MSALIGILFLFTIGFLGMKAVHGSKSATIKGAMLFLLCWLLITPKSRNKA